MFIGVILCNLIVVLLAFCGVVNVYNCLSAMEKEMGVDVFMKDFVPACTPLFMAACVYMLVQIACQIQRMNIELKMNRGSAVPGSSSPSASSGHGKAGKQRRTAEEAAENHDYFSLEDERKPRRGSRASSPAYPGTRPLMTPPVQPSLDAWNEAPERSAASPRRSEPARTPAESDARGGSRAKDSANVAEASGSSSVASSAASAVSTGTADESAGRTRAATPSDKGAAPSKHRGTPSYFSLD